jgi:hypothetical protein
MVDVCMCGDMWEIGAPGATGPSRPPWGLTTIGPAPDTAPPLPISQIHPEKNTKNLDKNSPFPGVSSKFCEIEPFVLQTMWLR